MKTLRVTGNVFILIGATFLFFVLYELVGTSSITRGHQSALAVEFGEPTIERPIPVRPDPKEPTSLRWPDLSPQDIVGRIRIPSLDVEYIVVEGTTLDDLALGPGHYIGTSLPGQVGSVGIAGHRTGWGSPFIDLDKLRRGDEIILDTKRHGRFVYRVTGTTVTHPRDVEVLQGDPDSDALYSLTLTTCTPKYTSRDRLIIWADQVQPVFES